MLASVYVTGRFGDLAGLFASMGYSRVSALSTGAKSSLKSSKVDRGAIKQSLLFGHRTLASEARRLLRLGLVSQVTLHDAYAPSV